MADSKEGTRIDASPSDPSSVANTTTNDSAPTEPAIVEKIKFIEEKDSPSGNKSAKSNAEETQSRKRSLEESSPATDDVDDAEIAADSILKRLRAGESAVNDVSDSKEKDSSDIKEVTENSATDIKVTAERGEATEGGDAGKTETAGAPHAGSTEKTEVKAAAGAEAIEGGDAGKTEPAGAPHSGSTDEKMEIKGTAGAPVSKEPQKASPEGTEKEKDKSPQNGTTDENKPAVPSLFGSSVSGASLFGTSSSVSSPFAFTGKSIFGSSSAFASGSSDHPMPFSAFSSNNPFLNAISKDKDDDNEENGEAEGENENDSADNFDQPYVQLNLEKKKVETGEEMETSVFNCRAKLYSLDPTEADKGWKERGVGVLHLNVLKDDTVTTTDTPEPSSADASKESTPTVRERKSKARIVMRADGVLKVILNLPLVKGIEVRKGMKSSLVSEKFVRISAWENHKPIQYALRMGNENVAAEFYDTAESLIYS
ncbi:hypothetical protein V1522DRAFT_406091 [Lipomyces starkeyi]